MNRRTLLFARRSQKTEPADTVSIIGVGAGKVVDTIRAGRGADRGPVSDDGCFAFVTKNVDASASVIDVTLCAVAATFAGGRQPNVITFTASPKQA